MNRPLLMLSTAMLVLFNSSLAPVAAGNYRFKPSAAPSFWYTGGDLFVVNIAGQLSGQVSIITDEDTGAANLRFVDVAIHSAFAVIPDDELPAELPKHWTSEFYEGKILTELDAFDSSIAGQYVSPTEIKFGPSLVEGTNRWVEHFKFLIDASSYRLSGGSFHSDDSPNYYIDGLLIPTPEPSAGCIMIVAASVLSLLRPCARIRRNR